jgi:Spy/CpxP family protein refolding chaperone
MKAKGIIIGLFLAGFMAASVQADAQNRRMNYDGEGPGTMMYSCIPDLTDDQESQLDALHTSFFNERKAIKADLDIIRAEKRKLMLADEPDEKAINAKIDEMSNLHAQLQKKKAAMHIAMKDVLTDEQEAAMNRHMGRKNCKMGAGHAGMKDGMGDGHHKKGRRGTHRPCMY